ncbi:MAG TPA: DUF1080 domain-containing protein, partial [Blastocatellia bacterium]|nr:DUF1080 domain-containing protein [Blastocatellia bacterium]
MSRRKFVAGVMLIGLSVVALGIDAAEWKKLFDGKTTNGWRLMAVHGGNGGVWTVENGAMVANQEKDHKGGLIGTEAKYSDYEIELEFKADNPVDTG